MRLGKAIATGYAEEAAEQQEVLAPEVPAEVPARPAQAPVRTAAEAGEPVPADAGATAG